MNQLDDLFEEEEFNGHGEDGNLFSVVESKKFSDTLHFLYCSLVMHWMPIT